jgi:hypothetical protein
MSPFEQLVHDIATSDPEGTVDCGAGCDTCGDGAAIEGCKFCGTTFRGPKEDWKHEPGCFWMRANALVRSCSS